MANLTPRLSAAQYLELISAGAGSRPAAAKKRPKYGNRKVATDEGVFDSEKEARTFADLKLAMQASDPALRVVKIERQTRFELVDKQPGERASHYLADFVVTYADDRVEVIDAKSVITRMNPVYRLKRKLMLQRHGIRILEV